MGPNPVLMKSMKVFPLTFVSIGSSPQWEAGRCRLKYSSCVSFQIHMVTPSPVACFTNSSCFFHPGSFVCSFCGVINLRLEQGFESLDFCHFRDVVKYCLSNFYFGTFIWSHPTPKELENLGEVRPLASCPKSSWKQLLQGGATPRRCLFMYDKTWDS